MMCLSIIKVERKITKHLVHKKTLQEKKKSYCKHLFNNNFHYKRENKNHVVIFQNCYLPNVCGKRNFPREHFV
jgi:hypothetical protein